jgi:hypothetical protein
MVVLASSIVPYALANSASVFFMSSVVSFSFSGIFGVLGIYSFLAHESHDVFSTFRFSAALSTMIIYIRNVKVF